MNEKNSDKKDISALSKKVAGLEKRLARSRALVKKLRQNSEQCLKIINKVKDGIFVESVRGKILDVNEAGCRMLGYTREELLSMDVGTLVPPQVAANLPDVIQKETLREEVYIETINVRKNGTHIPVEVGNTLIEIGGEKRVIAVLHDISERIKSRENLFTSYEDLENLVDKRTEELATANEELRRENHHCRRIEEDLREERQLFIGGPTVVFRWKAAPGWPVEYVSPNVKEQFGYDPADLLSGFISYESIIHPDDLARIADEIRARDESDVKCFAQSYRIAHAAGGYRWISDFTVLFRDREGKPSHYHGYILDVSKEKTAEKELNRYRRHLEEQVEKRTSELKGMVDAMAHRVVRMSDLEILVEKLQNQIRAAGLTPIGDPKTNTPHQE